ncbi:MAG: apolipoprotein N-acyltransferase [Candidatus Fischerbacteria bacterium RBG_13_37_8]|uniref:Apolipoprotein N-acyltransferase n=1 Tax=Candidatus Fischerbacteria bacterium RBG_13_37_8 TaxID=1817863 RepID=A0A1F5VFZ1_9BACT|nr:MAG: apolipoprotein N-acyltransferase [Candidatus Fischerbacteria bacterium RBG_13_37_8]
MTTRKKFLLLTVASLTGAILLALSFPKWDYSFLAWIALIPLIYAMKENARASFFYGFIYGVVCNYITFYWVVQVIDDYSNLPLILALLLNLLLSFYLALYWGVWTWSGSYFLKTLGSGAIWILPFLWIVLEYIRSYFLTGFPWCLLGYSQYRFTSLCQIASIAGVYGISFTIVAANCVLCILFFKRMRHRYWYGAIIVVVLYVALAVTWGNLRVRNYHDNNAVETVGIIQGNIPQDLKWLVYLSDAHFKKHLILTGSAISNGAKLIIWPEAAITIFFLEDKDKQNEIMHIVKESNVGILFGGDYRNESDSKVNYYNSAYFINPDDHTIQLYSKMHLVPFGEYVPLKKLLWFVDKFVEGVSDFSAGREYILFNYKNHRISTQICYEIIFPEISRAFVKKGSELLTTITNDAWFGETSAAYQHFAMATIRTIENKRYLVRSANTGISGIINPVGRIIHESDVFTEFVIIDKISFLKEHTFYTKYGDWICYLSICMMLLSMIIAVRIQKRKVKVEVKVNFFLNFILYLS